MGQFLNIQTLGAVRRIELNRPNERNAQSQALLQELDDAFQEAEIDPEVRVVVLTGVGRHFSGGHDLKEAQEKRSYFSVEQRWAYEEKYYFNYCMRIREFSKPTIAEVQGACIAAGFMVANMCDLIIASEDAFFSDPVVHSIGAAAVEILIHPWVLGLRKSKEFLFAGGRIGAFEAERIGLVNKVVPAEELTAETLKLANRIAEAPPFGIKLTKRSLNRTADMMGLRSSLEAHFDTHQLSHFTNEMKQQTQGGIARSISHGKALSRLEE